ncbi:phosphoenolpyruvate-protein phosphotransferase [Paenibacillus baekrokdamisoli]|uniref:Phosphoenolpyruvate-protein phosphotransferase n=2 Tax=Paenibacillus baekrokdamisoli TaxID=1712516 RepID=A0A3G9JMA9_9BACL|nr:phosphoenolpyruvate--protein phosphotransferase [Paenibacillus baekrokdamisoli]BBH24159.1 phosphoenolpyruvate-protein phosphotransferase [Paenibacillus baekrokdamisoli]
MMTDTIEQRLTGLGVSEGIRMGKVFVYKPLKLDEIKESKAEQPDKELARLELAKAQCTLELTALIERAQQTLGEEKAAILKGQISFLNDPAFYPPMQKLIQNEQWSAETAVRRTVNQVAGLFEAMANEYMRERSADIRDVGSRLMTHLVGYQGSRLTDITAEVILVADDLTPSDTVQLDKQYVLGFVTRIGGKTSHTAILANSLGIAAVLGLGSAIERIQHGEELIINGSTGEIVLHPEKATKDAFAAQLAVEQMEQESLNAYRSLTAVTKDGFAFEMAANIGTPQEAVGLLEKGSEAIGLYRTEFLFMSASQMPSEEIQFEAYRQTAEAMQGRPVVIRTLDIGGDKALPYLQLPEELNPFLGYRAIRLCLDQKQLFLTQLRAIIRAGAYGNVKIMFPMISGVDEWRQAKALYEEARQQLISEGANVGEAIEIGIMIEIPSAALMADRLAKEVDFFSIGTNDLVQYTVAVDRMNEKVSYLYDYFHPAIIQLIKKVIDASNKHGKWVGMCGTMAGDPLAAPLLVGLGLHEWSMSPSSIQRIKQTVRKLERSACVQLTERLLDLDTPAEIRSELEAFLKLQQ